MREDRMIRRRDSGGEMPATSIKKDIQALNSSILIISQKMKYLVRNEKVLGRNLLVLNKKLRDLEAGGGAGGAEIPANLQQQLDEIQQAISGIRAEIESMKSGFASLESVKEIKYVVDTINPVEFVTAKDVEKIIEEKTKKPIKKKSKR